LINLKNEYEDLVCLQTEKQTVVMRKNPVNFGRDAFLLKM